MKYTVFFLPVLLLLFIASGSKQQNISYSAQPPESGVKLFEGPLRSSMEINIKYLLANSKIDDMLYRFRQLAGNSNPLGQMSGWEKEYPAHAAQFMGGAGNTLRWLEQPELRERLNALVAGIKACRTDNGQLLVPGVGTGPLGKYQWGYSINMFSQGMVAAGRAGNPDAYELLAAAHSKYRALLAAAPDKIALTTAMNYSGQEASLLAYFSPVGIPEDIKAGEKFVSDEWMRLLIDRNPEGIWKAPVQWPHSAETYGFEGYLDLYRATGEKRYLDAMLGAWELMHENWQHVGGTLSLCEHQLYPPKCYPLTKMRPTGEICSMVCWIRFNQRLHLLFPDDEKYTNEIEKCLFNIILAGQDKDGKGFHYHMPLQGRKNDPDSRAQGPVPTLLHSCCEGMGTWLCGNLPEYIYSTSPDGLYVNLFSASEITWTQNNKSVTASMATRFPYESAVTMIIKTGHSNKFSLHLRIPSWLDQEIPIEVNGKPAVVGKPGSYAMIARKWSDGDQIRFSLPFRFRLHKYIGEDTIPGKKRYAITYGPLLLACVGTKEIPAKVTETVAQMYAYPVIWSEIRNDPARVNEWLVPDPGKPLEFRIKGTDSNRFITYWKLGNSQPFTCYPVIEP